MDFTTIGQAQRMERMSPMLPMDAQDRAELAIKTESVSFLDVFRGMVDNVIETNEQVDRDAIDVMLGISTIPPRFRQIYRRQGRLSTSW